MPKRPKFAPVPIVREALASARLDGCTQSNPCLIVEVAIPQPCLMPNRAGWGRGAGIAKAMATKSGRANAKLAALAAMGKANIAEPPMWRKARITPTFYVAHHNGLSADPMNRIASLKAVVDGLADAGLFANDRGVQWGEVKHGLDEFSPHVELVIEGLEQAPVSCRYCAALPGKPHTPGCEGIGEGKP